MHQNTSGGDSKEKNTTLIVISKRKVQASVRNRNPDRPTWTNAGVSRLIKHSFMRKENRIYFTRVKSSAAYNWMLESFRQIS
jgi:cellulase/cellobiase CelA1